MLLNTFFQLDKLLPSVLPLLTKDVFLLYNSKHELSMLDVILQMWSPDVLGTVEDCFAKRYVWLK